MKEEELREKLALLFNEYGMNLLGAKNTFPDWFEYADKAVALIREAGYRSPEEWKIATDLINDEAKEIEYLMKNKEPQ